MGLLVAEKPKWQKSGSEDLLILFQIQQIEQWPIK